MFQYNLLFPIDFSHGESSAADLAETMLMPENKVHRITSSVIKAWGSSLFKTSSVRE